MEREAPALHFFQEEVCSKLFDVKLSDFSQEVIVRSYNKIIFTLYGVLV